MNKFTLGLVLALFPLLACSADGSLTFAPPPSDYSVIFLGNIFGVVDGVLHGSGSQIMGSMFGVFNAAVLALGGIIIMYTLLVSTMNTAHEGVMLGQKWSSIWVPTRATLGLALLIPKASGYCLMQIIVMWVVVQGVGAADKVWDAALGYLNRGGVIIKTEANPADKYTNGKIAGATPEVAHGLQTMLAGQVCMLGLQRQLEKQRESLLSFKQEGTGACAGEKLGAMEPFCNTAVPDFINSVSFVEIQSKSPGQPTYSAPMPNFDKDAPYAPLNGICGQITWKPFDTAVLTNRPIKTPGQYNMFGGYTPPVYGDALKISSNDVDTAKISRAIALQQAYLDLTMVAQVMVNNDPQLASKNQNSTTPTAKYSDIATQQFGIPLQSSGVPCVNNLTENCTMWGLASGEANGPLFSGVEFQGAIADYNGIMTPAISLAKQADNVDAANSSRKFIEGASQQGWLMAGSYFFDLANLNAFASKNAGELDSKTGLEASQFDAGALSQAFGDSDTTVCSGILCTWLQKVDLVNAVTDLIAGSNSGSQSLTRVLPPDLTKDRTVLTGANSSTVYGFVINSSILQLPGQPGQKALKFADIMHVTVDAKKYQMQKAKFECGKVRITVFSFCLGRMLGGIFYNFIIVSIFSSFLQALQQFIDSFIRTMLMIPLQGMATIFKTALDIISTPGVNPVVALANMGTYYINFAAQMWMMGIALAAVPGAIIAGVIALVMPLVACWVTLMVAIGFLTAFYVPMLPYMIFTFGVIGWLIAVIEAMVAAPIVALGVTHPEGEGAFGKGEQAIMLIMNVFLRPSMMIIGYITAIALTYVGVWILNAGFDHAIGFIQGDTTFGSGGTPDGKTLASVQGGTSAVNPMKWLGDKAVNTGAGDVSGGYGGWAGVSAYFFSIIIYTSMYLTIVQKAFTLISVLPDKILRWIGGQPEQLGQETSGWAGDTQKQVEGAGEKSSQAQAGMGEKMAGHAGAAKSALQSKLAGAKGGQVSGKGGAGGGGGSSTPPSSTPPPSGAP